MADHFLDTETRYAIPATALCCVDAGLTTTSAEEAWRYQVVPAVGFNAWLVAGEWTLWDREWLLERIETQQAQGPIRRAARNLMRVPHMDGVFHAVARTMDVLWAEEDPVARRVLCADLENLAQHYFDFCGRPLAEQEIVRGREAYACFVHAMAPALVRDEQHEADERIRRALHWPVG